MEPHTSISTIRAVVDCGLFVLIWLVQLIIYPAFRSIEEPCFQNWHRQYTWRIAIIVAPLMLLQLGTELFSLVAGMPDWPRLLLIALVWTMTATLSVPCHRNLYRLGRNPETITRLIVSNWLRTIIWSALLFLSLTGIFSP